MISYERLTTFDKEFKRLLKKYRSLNDDISTLKSVLEVFPTGQSNNSEIVHDSPEVKIVKTRLFCRALRGSSLRLIYAFYPRDNRICFVEIYFKGEKTNEDRERIKDYLKGELIDYCC